MQVKETRNEAYLEVPIKLQPVEMRSFNNFLERLMKEYSYGMFRQLIIHGLTFKKSLQIDEKLAYIVEYKWTLTVNCASDFRVYITSRPNEDLKILITPYSTKKEGARWGGRDFQNLKIMAPVLRKELMNYLSYKSRETI